MSNNSNKPLVSIVVPVYNAQRFLTDAIRSVQEQTYSNWELILIDDCSTDKSVKLINQHIKHDQRISLIEMNENSGAALARNAGIKSAVGCYLAFLDADDIWVKMKLELQVDFMQTNNHIFTFTGYNFADEKCLPTGKQVHVPSRITYKQALRNHIISTPGVVIDLQKIDKDLIMMPNIRSGQDAATWWRILRHIEAAYGINKPLFYYRRTDNSLSANKFKAMKRTWYLFRKVEKINPFKSSYCFVWYGLNAVKKRV